MMGYVMGLDGGSSKSHLALFDTNGNYIDFVKWGPLNHESMEGGFEQLERELHDMLAVALERNGLSISGLRRGVFGMSGVDTCWQEEAIRGIFLRCGVKNPLVCNDAFLPIKAVSRQGYGIGAINGSGCTVAGIGVDGSMIQIGGCGGLTGDLGGGSNLGETVVRTVYASIYKGGPSTMMRDMLFEKLGISREEDFFNALAKQMGNETVALSDINLMLFEAANMGDAVALDLLSKVGEDSAMAIGGALSRLSFPDGEAIDVALAGSVHVKGSNPALVDALKRKVIELAGDRDIRFTITDRPPVMGAIVWALKDYLPAEEAIARVRDQL